MGVGGESADAWSHPGSVTASSSDARRLSPTTPSSATIAVASSRK